MFDINVRQSKKESVTGIFLIAVGILVAAFVLWSYISVILKYKNADSVVEAYNIEVTTHSSESKFKHEQNTGGITYSPKYYYRVDGEEFICETNGYFSEYPDENKNKVYYNSSNPSDCVTEYEKNVSPMFLALLFVSFICFFFGRLFIKSAKISVGLMEELNQKGKLIKRMPCRLEDSDMSVNNVKVKWPVVDYVLPTGEKLSLHGQPDISGKLFEEGAFIDLLIDENNPENYFIDFDINRLNGNSSSDYYKPSLNDNEKNK